MTGTSDTTFSPDLTTSRSMIATILWRMAGSPVVNYAMDFADVPADQWYAEAVRWASSEGIVGGYGNGFFGTGPPSPANSSPSCSTASHRSRAMM